MKSSRKLAGALAAASVLLSGTAQAAVAALVDRGGGLIYDRILNITWLQDANYAKTSGYDADGRLTWSQATTWAANLSYYDSVRNVTYTDWRLPTWTDTGAIGVQSGFNGGDASYNVNTASSELAHLWYVTLHNKAYYDTSGAGPQDGWGLVDDPNDAFDESLFTNIQAISNVPYWLGTEDIVPIYAWFFDTHGGNQAYHEKSREFYAWAIRPGDVAAVSETVPEPMSAALAGVGLAGLAISRRRRLR